MTLAQLIRAHRQEVLEHWKEQVRTLGDARDLPEPVLLNHVPDLLDWLITRQETRYETGDYAGHRLSREHAQERLEANFDMLELLAEFCVLRDVLLHLWVEEPSQVPPREVLHLNQDLDDVVMVCAAEFSRRLLQLQHDQAAFHPHTP